MKNTIQAFADLVHIDIVDCNKKKYPDLSPRIYSAKVNIRPGRKYTKVDVGRSGMYMVVIATGEIFGIKAYGVIHKGKRYGTLDTIDDHGLPK